MKTPVVELSDCILCGICEEVAPSVFRINELGFVEVADLSRYPEFEIEQAIKACPTNCIYWESV